MTSYVIAAVPAAARAGAEGAIQPLLVSATAPGHHLLSVDLVPHPGPSDAETTGYGCCSPSGEETVAALPYLTSAIPGSVAQAIGPDDYDYQRDWIGWLAASGWQPRVVAML
jgi:hypothetical protein